MVGFGQNVLLSRLLLQNFSAISAAFFFRLHEYGGVKEPLSISPNEDNELSLLASYKNVVTFSQSMLLSDAILLKAAYQSHLD